MVVRDGSVLVGEGDDAERFEREKLTTIVPGGERERNYCRRTKRTWGWRPLAVGGASAPARESTLA